MAAEAGVENSFLGSFQDGSASDDMQKLRDTQYASPVMRGRPLSYLRLSGTAGRRSVNRYVFRATMLACIASTLLGYDIGVSSGAILYIEDEFGLNDVQKEVFVGSLNLVSFLGALGSGRISDAFGRRRTVALSSVVFLAGALMMALAQSFPFLLAGRLVTGVGVGFGFTIAPLYTAELSPSAGRGSLVSLSEVFINAGILLGYVVSFALSGLPEAVGWRWMLGLGGVPAVILGLGVLAMPESPRWLVMRGRVAEAAEILAKTSTEEGEAEARLAEIMEAAGGGGGYGGGEGEERHGGSKDSKDSVGEGSHLASKESRGGESPRGAEGEGEGQGEGPGEGSPPRGRRGGSSSASVSSGRGVWRELLWPTPAVRQMLLLCLGTNFFQQVLRSLFSRASQMQTGACGLEEAAPLIVTADGENPTVFRQAGIRSKQGLLAATVGVGVTKTAFILVATFLLDDCGRRPLLLISATGMTCCLIVEGFGFLFLRQNAQLPGGTTASAHKGGGGFASVLAVLASCSFVAFFSIGLGPICWVLTSEIFPLRLRAQAFSLGTAVNRLTSGTVAMTFLSISNAISPAGCFFMFACVGIVSIAFFYVYAPETKGKSLEEISRMFDEDDGTLLKGVPLQSHVTLVKESASFWHVSDEEDDDADDQFAPSAHLQQQETSQREHLMERLKNTSLRGDSFLCVNQLDIGQCPKVEVEAEAHLHTLKAVLSSPSPDAAPRVLVPLGAGKDSITVFEMVSEKLEHMEGSSSAWFFLGDHCGEYARSWRYDAIVSASGASEPPVVMAHVFEDPAWESSCRPGVVPCGHPWAGLVAFCSVLASAYLGFNYIAVGNERSANFGNTTYMGLPVNHQYDKSFEFESAAHAYVNAHVAPGLHYFSALQHLWELQGGTRWCGACSKCLFVCILLGAFLEPPQVWAIFGDDLLQKQEMAGVLEELLGRGGKSKPFECVGTPEEVAHALFLCKQKYKEFLGGRRMPRLLADLELPPDAGRLRLKEDVNCENLLPDWLRPDSEA
eukprot:jgi/Mesen1/9470/ME000063S08920